MFKNNKENRIIPGTRAIILDIAEKECTIFMKNKEYAKELIDPWIIKNKAHKLFPEAIFKDIKEERKSIKKMDFEKQGISAGGVIYRIHLAFMGFYIRI